MSDEWIKAKNRLVEITNTPEKEFGDSDEEYDAVGEVEWMWATSLEKLELVVETAAEYLPLRSRREI